MHIGLLFTLETDQIIPLHFCMFNIFKKLDKNMAIKTLELVYLKGQLIPTVREGSDLSALAGVASS